MTPNNDKNDVNEVRNENVDNLSIKRLIKNIPDVYQILLQNQLLMQNLLHNQKVSVPNTNKGNNKITELRTILQRESPNS